MPRPRPVAEDVPAADILAVVGGFAVRSAYYRPRVRGHEHRAVEDHEIANGPRRQHHHHGQAGHEGRPQSPGAPQRRQDDQREQQQRFPAREGGYPHERAEGDGQPQARRIEQAIAEQEPAGHEQAEQRLGHQRTVGGDQDRIHRSEGCGDERAAFAGQAPRDIGDGHDRARPEDRPGEALKELVVQTERGRAGKQHGVEGRVGRRGPDHAGLKELGLNEAVAVSQQAGHQVEEHLIVGHLRRPGRDEHRVEHPQDHAHADDGRQADVKPP